MNDPMTRLIVAGLETNRNGGPVGSSDIIMRLIISIIKCDLTAKEIRILGLTIADDQARKYILNIIDTIRMNYVFPANN